MIDDPSLREFVLAFADDEHLMGQQHTEWIGVAPFLEEDLAFASIGQDELGHAAMLYALVVGDSDAAIDEIAFRSGEDFRSCHLVEYATTDWAEALVRQWMYDEFENLRWELVSDSSVGELADVAARAEREEAFHRRHAEALLDVLLADETAAARIIDARDRLASRGLAMFEPVAGESAALEAGVVSASTTEIRPVWIERVLERFGSPLPSVAAVEQASRTRRSDDFAPLLARMREVLDLDPAAVW